MLKTEAGEKVWDQLQNVDRKSKVEYNQGNLSAKSRSGLTQEKLRNNEELESYITANKITDEVGFSWIIGIFFNFV